MLSDPCRLPQGTGITLTEAVVVAKAAEAEPGKGKATATAKGSSMTPDDKPICFRYNSKAGCKKKDKCHFAHVCQLCFAKHPAYQCKAGAEDTQARVLPDTRRRLQSPEESARQDNAAPAVVASSATPAISAPAAVDAPAKPATASPGARKMRVLYLFAGQPHKWDMRDCLTKLGYEQGVDIHIDCIDIQRKPRIDLSKTKEREKILQAIRAGAYDAILLSPPRSTFSRAPWANFKGPRPVRSYENPRGLATLTGAERHKCILGNIFADFTGEVLELAAELDISFTLLEQPEDLGAMSYGPHAGKRPASMWQWRQLKKILSYKGFKTFSFHQGNLGASYPIHGC